MRADAHRWRRVIVLALLLLAGGAAPALAAPPTVSSLSPASGPTGTMVTIRGTNFDPLER